MEENDVARFNELRETLSRELRQELAVKHRVLAEKIEQQITAGLSERSLQSRHGREVEVAERISRPLRDIVRDAERVAIEDALIATAWNRAEAARRLQISYKGLLQKMRRCGFTRRQSGRTSSL